jgi:hypothetical protein
LTTRGDRGERHTIVGWNAKEYGKRELTKMSADPDSTFFSRIFTTNADWLAAICRTRP